MSVPEGAAASEQTSDGTRDSASLIESVDGLGAGFEGPQGSATLRNPSDNSIAAGPNHIVVAVNSRMAIFTKKGRTFDVTGRALYGPVNTNNVFKGFGGQCEASNNGDAVVRYDNPTRSHHSLAIGVKSDQGGIISDADSSHASTRRPRPPGDTPPSSCTRHPRPRRSAAASS